MRTSSRTRSGGSVSTIASAAAPSAARRTSHSMAERDMRISSRFAAPSSTTSTTGFRSKPPRPRLPPICYSNASPNVANRRPASGGCYTGFHVAGGWAPGRQRLLEMAVGTGEVAPRLEDLGVVLVELNQAWAAAGVVGGDDRGSESCVRLGVATLLGEHDPPQTMGLRLRGGLVQPHCQVERSLRGEERGLQATLFGLELGQAADEEGLAGLHPVLVEDANRAVDMTSRR